nr:hypothetical protein [Tanacetum cinerariifolium]
MDVEVEMDDLNQKFLTSLAPEWLMHTIFMDVEVEKDDINQKFLTSLAPEWLMHTIVWRNRNDLDTMSLDDLCNHLKVYEAEVQKKTNSNSQDMAFISTSKNTSNEDGNTACVTTAFPTGSVNVVTISQDTASAYIASQSNGNVVGARENVGTPVVQQSRIQCYNCKEYGHVARECQKPKQAKDAAYHKEKMLLCKQEEAGFQLNVEQADWRDDTDDEPDDQELEAHYIEHPKQSKSVNDTYPIEQDEHNVIIDSLDMSYDREQVDQDDDCDFANERDLLASLIEKLKCEIDDSKNRNKFLKTSNKALVDKLKDEIEDFKTKNKSLESSNNHFKEANNELSKTNQLMFKDLKKFQAELDRYHDVKYAPKINDLNQTILEMKKELFAHQETISIMSQEREAQIKFYKTRKDNEIDKVIALENKVKVLDNIVYKTGQSIQTMNMLNRNCKTSFAKPEFLKKAQRANPRLYDINCYTDNLALMLAPESNEVLRLEKESRSKLNDLIRPFDYEKLNNLYDLFVPQCEKSYAQRYFLERKFCPEIRRINADLEKFHLCLKEEMVADLRYFNSLELEVDSLKS